jgi:hypothetical protein
VRASFYFLRSEQTAFTGAWVLWECADELDLDDSVSKFGIQAHGMNTVVTDVLLSAGQARTINRGGTSIYEELQKAGCDP